MNKNDKNFDTGLRILEVLKVLLNENLKKIELIEKLKGTGKIDNVSTLEAFIKYFNTLEIMGFELEKVKNVYILKNALLQVDINQEEKEILEKIIKEYRIISGKTTEKHLQSAFLKINKYINAPFEISKLEEICTCDIKADYDEVKDNLIATIANLIRDNQMVNLVYKKANDLTEEIMVELKEIIEKNKQYYVCCYSHKLARNKKIALEKIVSLKQLPQKNRGTTTLNPIIFVLYGRLAHSYKLKPSEKVINFSVNNITVSNGEEDKETLLQRLLKYGENCKVISPKNAKKEFLDLTNQIIKNLEEN